MSSDDSDIRTQIEDLRREVRRLRRDYQATLALSDAQADVFLFKSRKTVEAICRQIYRRAGLANSGKPLRKLMLNDLLTALERAGEVPPHIAVPLRTIQAYGNLGSHDQGEYNDEIGVRHAAVCREALATVAAWYFADYLGDEAQAEIEPTEPTNTEDAPSRPPLSDVATAQTGAKGPNPVESTAPATASGVEELRRVAAVALGGRAVTSLFLGPHIAKDKVEAARESYASEIPEDQIVLLHDSTAFGGASDGFVVSPDLLAWKDLMSDPISHPLDEIGTFAMRPSTGFFELAAVTADGVALPKNGALTDDDLNLVSAVLTSILEHVRITRGVAAPPPADTADPSEPDVSAALEALGPEGAFVHTIDRALTGLPTDTSVWSLGRVLTGLADQHAGQEVRVPPRTLFVLRGESAKGVNVDKLAVYRTDARQVSTGVWEHHSCRVRKADERTLIVVPQTPLTVGIRYVLALPSNLMDRGWGPVLVT